MKIKSLLGTVKQGIGKCYGRKGFFNELVFRGEARHPADDKLDPTILRSFQSGLISIKGIIVSVTDGKEPVRSDLVSFR